MPGNDNTNNYSGGTNRVGRAYTSQVAPWDRGSNDVSVQRSLRDDNREWRDQRGAQSNYRGERALDRDYDYRNRGHNDREPNTCYRYPYNDYQRVYDNNVRRENLTRHRDEHPGYQRETDRAGWMNDRNRGRWNRR